MLKEISRALIEADVNVKLVKQLFDLFTDFSYKMCIICSEMTRMFVKKALLNFLGT